jgi:hypothetical protein
MCAVSPLRAAASEAADPLTLAARRNDFHQLLVPASIGNSLPLWCELDSGGGGPVVFIDAAKARAIGIQPTFYGSSAGPVEGALSPDLRARVTIAFPGLKLPEQEVVIKPDALPGDKDASIGMLLLSRFVVELDHASPAVRLHEPGAFRYSGPGRVLPFTIRDNNPFTTATLSLRDGQRLTAQMVIDTGAAGSIAYFSHNFATKVKLAERSFASVPDTVGRTACRIGRFSLGDLGVDRPVVHHFGTPGFGGKTAPDGMIAVDFLRRFRVFLDYTRSRMILEPGPGYREPPAFDASGLRVHRIPNSSRSFRIYDVLPGTPAAEAGLQTSDLLVALDDVPMDRMSPGMVQEALTREGRVSSLLIQRGDEVFTVRIKLRSLL